MLAINTILKLAILLKSRESLSTQVEHHYYDLLYLFDTNSFLVIYFDSDWVGNDEDRNSTYDGCFFLGNKLIFWFRKKHYCVYISTEEV